MEATVKGPKHFLTPQPFRSISCVSVTGLRSTVYRKVTPTSEEHPVPIKKINRTWHIGYVVNYDKRDNRDINKHVWGMHKDILEDKAKISH